MSQNRDAPLEGETVQAVALYCNEGGRDAEYHLQLVKVLLEDGSPSFVVNFQHGRRGTKLRQRTKTPKPKSLNAARGIFEDTRFAKTRERGYREVELGAARQLYQRLHDTGLINLGVDLFMQKGDQVVPLREYLAVIGAAADGETLGIAHAYSAKAQLVRRFERGTTVDAEEAVREAMTILQYSELSSFGVFIGHSVGAKVIRGAPEQLMKSTRPAPAACPPESPPPAPRRPRRAL